jgi:hypothetical protein
MYLRPADSAPKVPPPPPVVPAVSAAPSAPSGTTSGAPVVVNADDLQARRGFMMARNRSAAHLYIALGMTAQRNGIHAEIVNTAPTTIKFQLKVKADEDCTIAPVNPRMTKNGLEIVDIHRPNKEGVKTQGEDPEKYQWYKKQDFEGRVVVKEDVSGVRFARPKPENDVNGVCLGEAEFRLTDFSGPPQSLEDSPSAHIVEDLHSHINS